MTAGGQLDVLESAELKEKLSKFYESTDGLDATLGQTNLRGRADATASRAAVTGEEEPGVRLIPRAARQMQSTRGMRIIDTALDTFSQGMVDG